MTTVKRLRILCRSSDREAPAENLRACWRSLSAKTTPGLSPKSSLQFGINLRLGGKTSLRIINVQINDKARLLYELAKVSQRTPGPIGKDVIYSAVVQKIIGADSGGGGAEKHERQTACTTEWFFEVNLSLLQVHK